MAEVTGISWTRSTFNPWIGCTKVGPGCDGCYADALDARMKFGGARRWGAGVPRYRTSPSNWAKPLAWNKQAEKEHKNGISSWDAGPYAKMPAAINGQFWPVFCASLGDVFDNEVPTAWRDDLWALIASTPNLSWLLVTKRIGNVRTMVPHQWFDYRGGFPPNVRILITVVNQEEADRDIPKLLALPCKNGISYEPALGPVDWRMSMDRSDVNWRRMNGGSYQPRRIGWIIVGGESSQPGHPARPFNVQWARNTIAQCRAAGVPVFVKQLGSSVLVRNDSMEEWPDEDAFSDAIPDDYEPQYQGEGVCIRLKDRAGADPIEWPEDLRMREFPG